MLASHETPFLPWQIPSSGGCWWRKHCLRQHSKISNTARAKVSKDVVTKTAKEITSNVHIHDNMYYFHLSKLKDSLLCWGMLLHRMFEHLDMRQLDISAIRNDMLYKNKVDSSGWLCVKWCFTYPLSHWTDMNCNRKLFSSSFYSLYSLFFQVFPLFFKIDSLDNLFRSYIKEGHQTATEHFFSSSGFK